MNTVEWIDGGEIAPSVVTPGAHTIVAARDFRLVLRGLQNGNDGLKYNFSKDDHIFVKLICVNSDDHDRDAFTKPFVKVVVSYAPPLYAHLVKPTIKGHRQVVYVDSAMPKILTQAMHLLHLGDVTVQDEDLLNFFLMAKKLQMFRVLSEEFIDQQILRFASSQQDGNSAVMQSDDGDSVVRAGDEGSLASSGSYIHVSDRSSWETVEIRQDSFESMDVDGGPALARPPMAESRPNIIVNEDVGEGSDSSEQDTSGQNGDGSALIQELMGAFRGFRVLTTSQNDEPKYFPGQLVSRLVPVKRVEGHLFKGRRVMKAGQVSPEIFFCEICAKVFNNKADGLAHLKKEREKGKCEGFLYCKVCKEVGYVLTVEHRRQFLMQRHGKCRRAGGHNGVE